MKEFKGTKFPWNVQNELTIWGLYEGEKVCDVTETKDIHTSLRNDICRHNAKLISAAPELLEFVIEMVKRYPNSPWITEEGNKAINKALGL